MFNNLTNKKIILASKSPRRQELLKGLGLSFKIKTKEINEDFPNSIDNSDVAAFLAKKKAESFALSNDEIIITSDTTVLLTNRILNKPQNTEEALRMLQRLSGKTHEVCTGVCIKSIEKEIIFSEFTSVTFKLLSLDEIEYYIKHFQPYDKAGSYGIQEWIGFIGVEKIEGCYYNVMGLPISKLYQKLLEF
ncbi:MAG: septum formation protein Maf [Flavobacteriales bacterium]|nr:septum formation protein Maf [Flavobacteriales bacterium]|tara:strand:+ start:153 stop:725 length:573 start_codon:yes stop_codon:yes gene_type:complete